MNRRRAAWGAAAVAGYVAVALVSFATGLLPVRPLFDGLAPPVPYRWVRPPEGLEKGNQKPAAGETVMQVLGDTSPAGGVGTGDGQLLVNVQPGSFPEPDGTRIALRVTPLDPTSLAPPPPGRQFDSNAYRVEARAGDRVLQPVKPVTIVMRYARGAEGLATAEGKRWEPVEGQTLGQSFQLTTQVPRLGTFVALGPAHLGEFSADEETPLWVFGAAGTAVGVLMLGSVTFVARRRRRGEGRVRPATPPTAPAKQARPVRKTGKKKR